MKTAARCRSASLGNCLSRSMARARSRPIDRLGGREVEPANLGHRIDGRGHDRRPPSAQSRRRSGPNPSTRTPSTSTGAVEHGGSGILPAAADGVGPLGRGEAEHAAAAPGAAYLAGPGAVADRVGEQRVDERRRHGRGQLRAGPPFVAEGRADRRPRRRARARRGDRRSPGRSRRSTWSPRGSPSMRRLVMSQLLMPESRGAPV